MTDASREIDLVTRHVADREIAEGKARTVALARTYDTTPADLWNACTDPLRIPRWFLPVSGDLRLGGRYQLEGMGDVAGVIERCDPPRSFAATWEHRGSTSWIEVRIEAMQDGRARFELEHTALVEEGGHWEEFGPGAVGIGWDLLLLQGLSRHLASGEAVDPAAAAAWTASDEGRAFMTLSSERWCEADIAAGADPAEARAAAERTIAAYTAG